MKKVNKALTKEELAKLPEDALERYDWSKATRGRHYGKVRIPVPQRRLDDDLAEIFPNSKAVNDALRALLALRDLLPARARRGKNAAA
jgi:hypothetical protein